jgi:thiol:disulfide interchange protein
MSSVIASSDTLAAALPLHLPPSPLPLPTTAKECGLHSGNVKKDGSTEQKKADRDLWINGSAVQTLDKAAAEKLAGGARDKDTLLVLYAPWCQFCQVGRVEQVVCVVC